MNISKAHSFVAIKEWPVCTLAASYVCVFASAATCVVGHIGVLVCMSGKSTIGALVILTKTFPYLQVHNTIMPVINYRGGAAVCPSPAEPIKKELLVLFY